MSNTVNTSRLIRQAWIFTTGRRLSIVSRRLNNYCGYISKLQTGLAVFAAYYSQLYFKQKKASGGNGELWKFLLNNLAAQQCLYGTVRG